MVVYDFLVVLMFWSMGILSGSGTFNQYFKRLPRTLAGLQVHIRSRYLQVSL